MMLATAKSTKSAGYIAAEINGQLVSVACDRELSPAVNDVLVVDKIGSLWYAFGRTDVSAPAAQDGSEGAPPNRVTTGTLTVSPVETRSYRTTYGWRTDDDDVYQGEYGSWGNHTGCVFYGTKPRSLDGATVTDATIRVQMYQIGSYPPQASTMRLMTNATKPSGAPTLTSSATGPRLAQGETFNGFDVPVAWVQAMVDGTAGGIAFFTASGSPYLRFAGRSRWSPSFTLTIQWRR